MKAFFRNLLATIIGLIIFSFTSIILFVAFVGFISAEEEITIKPKSVIVFNLNTPILEKEQADPLEELGFASSQGSNTLMDIKKSIKTAINDENIEGIYLKAGFGSPGYAIIEELRNDLNEFKESGKWIMAYGNIISEPAYYFSSVADKIFLHPEGEMELNGLRSSTTFFKGTFDKLGVEPQIFRVGKFKSFVEPFTRTSLSKENKKQQEVYLNSLNDHMLKGISESRNLPYEELKDTSGKMLVRNANDAVTYGLVDELLYTDQVINWIKEKIDMEESEDIETISIGDYAKYANALRAGYKKEKIAVITAEGDIVDGEGSRENVGGDKFGRAIRKARRDDNVKAIVIRINSPGGSALASDVMWREVKLASEEKPVIASMSNVAASGGYYLAMAADTIVAQPNTITGSIGIFGMIFNLEKFMEDKLGVTTDVVSTGKFSDLLTLNRPLNEQEKQIIQNAVEAGYQTFISKAAEGRGVSNEEINEVAQGRVWTGIDAKENGLVDVLGGYDKSIQLAAEAAKLEEGEYQLKFYPKEKPLFEELLEGISSNVEAYFVKDQFGNFSKYINQLEEVLEYNGIMAKLPYDLEIH